MKKLLIVPLIVWNLQAQDFSTFLHDALQTSPYLKANALELERAKEQASLMQRYKNPILSIEASKFNPDVGKSDSGYRTAIEQPIRLWGVGSDQVNLATAIGDEAKGLMRLKRAEFVKLFSLLYIDYMIQSTLVGLAKEEFIISKKIANISKKRYKAGTIAQVKYFRAKVDLSSSKNALNEKKALQMEGYYKLLAFSGLKYEKTLDANYVFKLSNKVAKEGQNSSAKLHYLQAQQKSANEKAKLNANKIEWMNMYAEYEAEPDQDIARIGVGIPLAVFNTKTEEKRIASLKAKQSEFLIQNQKTVLFFTLERLQKQLHILENVIGSTRELYDSQKELLKMYEEGYKIATVNLLELQNIKNQMIETKEKEIRLQSLRNKNIVIYNYEVGEYND